MEMHRCNICFRNFATGRALGGHMRSHTRNFCASKNASNLEKFPEIDQLHRSTTHSCSSTDFPEISVVLQDGESDAESSRNNLSGRRSKRKRVFSSEMVRSFSKKFGETNEEQQQSPALSSVSDATTEEDVARCLMMLSRDKWERESEEEEEEEEDSEHVVKVKSSNAKVRGKYKCETCNKLFKSYQALGGHRASYKKIKSARSNGGGPVAAEVVVAAAEKVHECPYCHRVFASGQALGGHKRSHFMGASNSFNSVSRNVEIFDIDLNLPAPIDDDDQ